MPKNEKRALKAKLKKVEEELQSLNDRMREAKNKQADLKRFELNSSIISLKLDCRLHEHLIHEA